MTFEGNGNGIDEGVPPRRSVPHYHGDEVRVLFFISAIVLIVAQSTGADLPLSTVGIVVSAVLLVIAAGVTNPLQYGIHWVNALLAITGALFFGMAAVDNYRAGINLLNPSFVYVEALALLSLMALYFTIRTIRGINQRPNLS